MENDFLKVELDTLDGTVKSLIDKKSGKEMVSTDSEWKFGQYVNERFSKTITDQYAKDYIKGGWNWAYAELGRINLTDEPYQRISGKHPKIELVKDEISVSARVHFSSEVSHGHTYSVIFTLYQDKPWLETIWSINGKPADAWPEGGWISFPLNIEKPQFKLGRPGAIVDPATDFVKGSNLDYGFLNTGMAVVDTKGQGAGITSPDVPAVSLDRPGLWKYSTSFIPQKPNVFFNLYNNQWGTNFTEWIEGSWSARFYIWGIGRYENEASVITPSEEIRNPLMAGHAYGNAGNMPVSSQGISLSEKGILITAFEKNQDGIGTVLRLWEQAGKTRNIEVHLPEGHDFKFATPVNLRGEPVGNKFPVTGNSLHIGLKAYCPYSCILEH
jgi:hypothetical protein